MKTQIDQPELDREALSALMDGELRDAEAGAALQSLGYGGARECWQLYHLVGDVLRSPDLAARARDPDFLGRLSARLQQEPRPLSAMPAQPTTLPDLARPAANDGVFRWKLVAGLASFAAVVTMGWSVMGGIGPQSGAAPQLAQARPGGLTTQVVTLQAAPVPQPTTAETAAVDAGDMGAVMLRDPRLDDLLAAHRQTSGASALGGSAGFLRNATFEGPGR